MAVTFEPFTRKITSYNADSDGIIIDNKKNSSPVINDRPSITKYSTWYYVFFNKPVATKI